MGIIRGGTCLKILLAMEAAKNEQKQNEPSSPNEGGFVSCQEGFRYENRILWDVDFFVVVGFRDKTVDGSPS
jgi:hypothetical protein